ncbi:META domain-containing protein [Microbulbifer sp. HZ11]|uniref:META domain-containing protein n=1 Tax=unclassified Microbulbifer TaxID=2619833 RepID=UPI0009DEC039|nr:META domain-containing protein [Microbulbifer sp. HZ11]
MYFSHRSLSTPIHGAPRTLGALLAGLILSSALSSGCSSTPQPLSASQPMPPGDICNYQWILHGISVDGREQKSRLFWQKMVRDRPYLTCDKLGFVRGSAGSNPYLGKFDLADNGAIEWVKAPKISRMVGRKDSSELEKDFLKALPRINRASVEGDILTLQGGEGTRIEFKQTGELPGPSH